MKGVFETIRTGAFSNAYVFFNCATYEIRKAQRLICLQRKIPLKIAKQNWNQTNS